MTREIFLTRATRASDINHNHCSQQLLSEPPDTVSFKALLPFTLPQSLQIACAVNKPDNINGAFGHMIDEPKVSDKELADTRILEFRHHTTALSETGQRPRRVPCLTHERCCIPRGILGDVACCCFEIDQRRRAPGYSSSHLDILRSASSWLSTRPSSMSLSPRSTFWRT